MPFISKEDVDVIVGFKSAKWNPIRINTNKTDRTITNFFILLLI